MPAHRPSGAGLFLAANNPYPNQAGENFNHKIYSTILAHSKSMQYRVTRDQMLARAGRYSRN
jgi:hypothetical protein